MGNEDVSRREGWQPPERPEWVRRINEEGAGMDIAGIVPLDPESLIATATRNTGLSDFGRDNWREPFELICKCLETESQLHLMGRIMGRSDLLMYLEARLRVEDIIKRHPEIEDEQIEKPIWILGQGRSGTSILQKLLGMDPENRELTVADALFPVRVGPPGPGNRHPQFDLADHRIQQWNRVTPTVTTVHDFAGHEPIETIMIEGISFRSIGWIALMGMMPSFNGYMERIGYEEGLAYGKKVLKVIQWQNPGGRWVLKSPDATRYMPALMKVYPDIRLVWSHRDPVKALSSAINMIGSLMWLRSDLRIPPGAWDAITDPVASAAMMSKPIEWLESGLVPKEQFCNFYYHDLMTDAVGAIEKMYAYFGITMCQAAKDAIGGYLKAHPRDSRPPHQYTVGEQARIDKERTYFQRYEDYFKVPREV